MSYFYSHSVFLIKKNYLTNNTNLLNKTTITNNKNVIGSLFQNISDIQLEIQSESVENVNNSRQLEAKLEEFLFKNLFNKENTLQDILLFIFLIAIVFFLTYGMSFYKLKEIKKFYSEKFYQNPRALEDQKKNLDLDNLELCCVSDF